jgi:pimeloyl-ACP methyl ester carboxylesterase
MDVLDLHNVTLVAHSMGAEVARYFSRYGSGRVSRLVILAPTPPEADVSNEPRDITVPTLTLHGSIEGASHGLFLTHIEEINRELLRFARA